MGIDVGEPLAGSREGTSPSPTFQHRRRGDPRGLPGGGKPLTCGCGCGRHSGRPIESRAGRPEGRPTSDQTAGEEALFVRKSNAPPSSRSIIAARPTGGMVGTGAPQDPPAVQLPPTVSLQNNPDAPGPWNEYRLMQTSPKGATLASQTPSQLNSKSSATASHVTPGANTVSILPPASHSCSVKPSAQPANPTPPSGATGSDSTE